MRTQSGTFSSDDSWVLLSVLLCGRNGGSLRDLLATGDYANHAVMSFAILRGGLHRLRRAGLVVLDGGKYRAAPRAVRRWLVIRERERNLISAWRLLERWLEKQTIMGEIARYGRITNTSYQRAVAEYLKTG